MSLRGESIRAMHPLFQEGQGGSIPTSPLQLRFHECHVFVARELNKLWHSRLPVTVESNLTRCHRRAFFAAQFDGVYYATAIWTDPIAFGLPRDWMELRRFAIAPDAPKNSASRMLSWMVKQIRRMFPDVVRLISYQDCEVHQGTIYKAAGWAAGVKSYEHRNRGERTGRKRNMQQTTATKQRWEMSLCIKTYIVCNHCGTEARSKITHDMHDSVSAQMMAKNDGWHFSQDGRHYCPECAPKEAAHA